MKSIQYLQMFLLLAVSPTRLVGSSESCPGSGRCYGTYCPIGTCVDGTCECLNDPFRDRCTCLSTIHSCHIRNGASNALATATSNGGSRTTYSCVANDNCDYEVHVIGNYESNSQHSFRYHPTGYTNLYLSVTGESSRSLVLVLSSYEPVQWTLHIPTGVVLSKVIISSFHNNSVAYSPGEVLSVENTLSYFAYGSDSGGGDTTELLDYLYNRFGPVSSFTGTYQANVWRLNINRGDPDSNCVSVTSPTLPSTLPPTLPPTGATNPVTSVTPTSIANLTKNYDNCMIRSGGTSAVGTPTYRGSPPRNGYITYSCVANNNCDYEVHAIGNYESNSQHSFAHHPTGNTDLYLSVTGESSRPLVLVLSSYEPVRWTLRIPTGVVLSKVIISSYHDNSVAYSPGEVLSVENTLSYYAYGSDSGGGDTEELLDYLYNRFGPVSSFTGTYQANVWRLNINRTTPDANCVSVSEVRSIPDSTPGFVPNSTPGISSLRDISIGVLVSATIIMIIISTISVVVILKVCRRKTPNYVADPVQEYDDPRAYSKGNIYPIQTV